MILLNFAKKTDKSAKEVLTKGKLTNPADDPADNSATDPAAGGAAGEAAGGAAGEAAGKVKNPAGRKTS